MTRSVHVPYTVEQDEDGVCDLIGSGERAA
jgi:hypothetical protein